MEGHSEPRNLNNFAAINHGILQTGPSAKFGKIFGGKLWVPVICHAKAHSSCAISRVGFDSIPEAKIRPWRRQKHHTSMYNMRHKF